MQLIKAQKKLSKEDISTAYKMLGLDNMKIEDMPNYEAKTDSWGIIIVCDSEPEEEGGNG